MIKQTLTVNLGCNYNTGGETGRFTTWQAINTFIHAMNDHGISPELGGTTYEDYLSTWTNDAGVEYVDHCVWLRIKLETITTTATLREIPNNNNNDGEQK